MRPLGFDIETLRVLINDTQAHQTSVDTLNDDGRQLAESGKGSDDANKTQQCLVLLNKKWSDLCEKASNLWLNDIDGALSTTKPETASEQLQRFMEVYNELEQNRPLIEGCLQRGGAASSLQHNLRTLKQQWDNAMNRANDKKIELEIALKEATNFTMPFKPSLTG